MLSENRLGLFCVPALFRFFWLPELILQLPLLYG